MLFLEMTPGVLSRAAGLPEAEAVTALRDACAEFCTRTYALTDVRSLSIPSGDRPGGQQMVHQVVDIVDARIAGKPVYVTYANDPLVDALADGGSIVEDGINYEYALTWQDPSYVTLTPEPPESSPVVLDLMQVIAPGPEATGVHDVLWLRHSEAIRHGALARVLAVPGPWMSAPSVVYHRTEFERAISVASGLYAANRRTARRLRVLPASI